MVGLPFAGKSTVFTALTKVGAAGGRANQAVVSVPDHRLGVLAALERSRRIVQAQVRFLDVPGGTASAQGLAALLEVDALCIVLRTFGPDPSPALDLAKVREELLLADLAVVDSALANARRRSRAHAKQGEAETELLERAEQILSAEVPLREAELSDADRRVLRGLAPLTLKPWVIVANVEEGRPLPEGLPDGAVGVWAAVEAETAGMPEEDARALLSEFGVDEPGLDALIRASYQALDLLTFLTTGEDETRAWEVRRGASAPEAAGVVHTDLQRGFIRAEVVSYDDLVAAGGWDAAKDKGLLRVEGKDYVVREGDILHVRFAV